MKTSHFFVESFWRVYSSNKNNKMKRVLIRRGVRVPPQMWRDTAIRRISRAAADIDTAQHIA